MKISWCSSDHPIKGQDSNQLRHFVSYQLNDPNSSVKNLASIRGYKVCSIDRVVTSHSIHVVFANIMCRSEVYEICIFVLAFINESHTGICKGTHTRTHAHTHARTQSFNLRLREIYFKCYT
jgi:hypothetical protein